MVHLKEESYKPIAAHRPVYDRLYAEYVKLYDTLGRGENPVMKTLKRIRAEALGIGGGNAVCP